MITIKNPTAILGLDELFKNRWIIPSFPNEGIVILIKGKPGTGKTSLSLQLLLRLINLSKNDLDNSKEIKQFPTYIQYYSMEQSKTEIERRMRDIYIAQLKFFFRTFSDNFLIQTSPVPEYRFVNEESDEKYEFIKNKISINFNQKEREVFNQIKRNKEILPGRKENEFYRESDEIDPLEKIVKEELYKLNEFLSEDLNKLIVNNLSRKKIKEIHKLLNDLNLVKENRIKDLLCSCFADNRLKELKDFAKNKIEINFGEMIKILPGETEDYELEKVKNLLIKRNIFDSQKVIGVFTEEIYQRIKFVKDSVQKKSLNVVESIPADKEEHGWKMKYIAKKLFYLEFNKFLQIESRKEQGKDNYFYDSVIVWLNKKLNDLAKRRADFIPNFDKKENNQLTHKLIVVDGLNATSLDERKAFDFERLINRLKKTAMISIVVIEPTEVDYSPIENFADIIIDLIFHSVTKPFEYTTNQLIISKARHQHHTKGMHQYSIPERTSLLTVYPSDYFYLAKYTLRKGGLGTFGYGPFEMLSLKDRNLKKEEGIQDNTINGNPDEVKKDNNGSLIHDGSVLSQILGGIRRGSNTVILGPRRTSKSLLTLDFILSGYNVKNQNIENGLIVSLLDNFSAISKSKNCRRIQCESYWEPDNGGKEDIHCNKCFEKVSLFHLNPEVVSPNIFFYYLRRALDFFVIQGKPIERLTFWDFTQMDITFPLLSEDKLFVSTLFKFLKYYIPPYSGKTKPITSVFFASPSCNLAKSSIIADNVIYVWRDLIKSDLGSVKVPDIIKPLDFDAKKLTVEEIDSYIKKILHYKLLHKKELSDKEKSIMEEPNWCNTASKERFIKENSDKEQKNKDKLCEFLIIYIDRVEYTTQTRPREFFAFPIDSFRSPLIDFSSENILDYKLNDSSFLSYTEEKIKIIEQMQGLK